MTFFSSYNDCNRDTSLICSFMDLPNTKKPFWPSPYLMLSVFYVTLFILLWSALWHSAFCSSNAKKVLSSGTKTEPTFVFVLFFVDKSVIRQLMGWALSGIQALYFKQLWSVFMEKTLHHHKVKWEPSSVTISLSKNTFRVQRMLIYWFEMDVHTQTYKHTSR